MDIEQNGQNETALWALDAEPSTGSTPAAEPATPPEVTPPPEQAPPQVPKKSRSKRNVIIGCVAAVTVIAGALIAWLLLQPQETKVIATPEKAITKPADSAKIIISKINTAVSDNLIKQYPALAADKNDPEKTGSEISPSFKVKGAEYYVTINKTHSLTYTVPEAKDTANKPDNQELVKAIIKQAGLTFDANDYKQTDESLFGTEYQSDTVVCTVSPPEDMPVNVNCADKADFTATSLAVKPLVEAYLASKEFKGTGYTDDIYSSLSIKDSSVTGYQNATMSVSSRQSIGGAALLFYRQTNTDWKFFTGTQNILLCSAYTTADERSAFYDSTCATSDDSPTTVGEYASSAAGKEKVKEPAS